MLAGQVNLDTHTFAVEEIPTPDATAGQVRIKVAAAGVCLTDLHVINGLMTGPRRRTGQLTLGHEVAGVIDQLGPDVSGWSLGQRVVLSAMHHRTDGVFALGLDYDGGWAEYMVAPADMLVAVPDSMPLEVASIIPDAISTPWGAVTQTAAVRPGEAVAVWGVGGVGTHAIQILRFAGAAPIIAVDPLPSARQRAIELGADYALEPGDDLMVRISEITNGQGVDAAFDFVGNSEVETQAVEVLTPGGRAVYVGANNQPAIIPDPIAFVIQNKQIRGHFGSDHTAIPTILRLVERGRLDFSSSVTEVLPLSEAKVAIDHLERKVGSPVRIVLAP